MTVVNTVLPTLSGTARVGSTLTTTNGSWTFDLDYLSYDYEWLRCDAAGVNCSVISGQSGSSYLLRAADVGHTIRSRVTATEHTSANYPVAGPLTITSGGTYGGFNYTATSPGQAAITVNTTEPVIIENAAVTNIAGGGGVLIDALRSGVQLTVENIWGLAKFIIPNNESPTRFLWTGGHSSLVVQNCTFENTAGIEINGPTSSGTTTLITKNRCINIQGYVINSTGTIRVGNFVQFRVVGSGSHVV